MRFYKLINDDTFIGVITENDFRKYQKKNGILLVSNSKEGQYVRFNDVLYRDRSWMNSVVTDKYEYINIDIININEEEYNILSEAIKTNKEIEMNNNELIEDDDPIIDTIELSNDEQITLDFVKKSAISKMNSICNKTIVNGFDITLSDGYIHHFSLTVEDQLNLLNAFILLNNGAEEILYHADNESYKYFSKDDIALIINKANELKKYHLSYCNSIKSYINSLSTIESINGVTYGDELPREYRLYI